MGWSPAWAILVLVSALGTAHADGRSQVTPACFNGECDEPREGQSILQVKPLERSSEPPVDVLEDGVADGQSKLQQAAQKMRGATEADGKKKGIKGKVLLQTDTSALSRGGPVEEDTREDFRRVPLHVPVRVTEEQEIVKSTSRGEEINLKENHMKGGRKGRKPAKANSLVQMANTKSKAQLRDEDVAEEEEGEEEEEEVGDRFANDVHISTEEEEYIARKIARAAARGATELSTDSIDEIVKSAALFQQLTPSVSLLQGKEHTRQVNDSISGTEDADHGHSAQDMLDAIAAEEEGKLSTEEQKASEEAASKERLLPPNQTALLQTKSRPSLGRKIFTEDPQKPSTRGADFYDWVSEKEEAESQSAAQEGEMRKPAKGKSLVQMTNRKYQARLHEEEASTEEEEAEEEEERFARNVHISAEEEQAITARIARAEAQGVIHPSKDLTEDKLNEVVKSAALFQQLTHSLGQAKRQVNDGISGTEDATHGNNPQAMLDAIAAAEEEKLSDAEQKASEEAASEERLLPPNQTALMQKSSHTILARKIFTEEPQRPSTNGQDFYEWIAQQEEAATETLERKDQQKPAKGSSAVQMANEEEVHSGDEGERFANSVHISAEEEQHILARIAQAKTEGALHPSRDLTEAQIQELVKSAARLKQRQVTRQVNDSVSGTEDATHGHNAQATLDAIAAAAEDTLTEEEQKASDEAASKERLLPPNQTSLAQKRSH